MPVLGYAACQQHRQRHDTSGVERYENQVRPGFRNKPYGGSQQDHKCSVVADPSADIPVFQAELHKEQNPECPEENHRQMLPDDMMPQVFIHESV